MFLVFGAQHFNADSRLRVGPENGRWQGAESNAKFRCRYIDFVIPNRFE
jgi:hypothetical protein